MKLQKIRNEKKAGTEYYHMKWIRPRWAQRCDDDFYTRTHEKCLFEQIFTAWGFERGLFDSS